MSIFVQPHSVIGNEDQYVMSLLLQVLEYDQHKNKIGRYDIICNKTLVNDVIVLKCYFKRPILLDRKSTLKLESLRKKRFSC